MSFDIIALVMAAGYSRRFGAADKRLAQFDGTPLLARCVDNARRAFPVVRVVVRRDDELKGIEECAFRVERAHYGLGASIGEAFARLERDATFASINAAAVLLGDMPYLRPATLQALMQQAAADRIVVPRHERALGHPVIFGRAFWPELAALTGGEGAKAVLNNHPAHQRIVPVDDPGVLKDIDRPEDLTRT